MNNKQAPTATQLETFQAVATNLSFTRAAEQLGRTKSAVSQIIKQLEIILAVPLFIRSTRRISLTEEGGLLLQQCERVQAEVQAATSLLETFKQKPSGTLTISCNPYWAVQQLSVLLQSFLAEYSDLSINLLTEERMPNMLDEQVDVVFGINWPAPENIVAKAIGETRYLLCASPDYLAKHGEPKTLQAFQNHRYIPHRGRSDENFLIGISRNQIGNVHVPVVSNSAQHMKELAMAGLGITQLHDYMVADEIAQNKLVEICRQFAPPPLPLYMYYQKHRFVQPKIRCFVNRVLGVFPHEKLSLS